MEPREKMKLGLVSLPLFGWLSAFGVGCLLAEGPHGPNREITGDPVWFKFGFPFIILGLSGVCFAIRMIIRGFAELKERR